MILFVGIEPSRLNKSDQAFLGSPSVNTLTKWLSMAKIPEDAVLFENCFKSPIKKPKAKDRLESANRLNLILKQNNKIRAIVACGRIPAKIVKEISINLPILEIPHPSGRNILLNDPSVHVNVVLSLRSLYESLMTWSPNDTQLQDVSAHSSGRKQTNRDL